MLTQTYAQSVRDSVAGRIKETLAGTSWSGGNPSREVRTHSENAAEAAERGDQAVMRTELAQAAAATAERMEPLTGRETAGMVESGERYARALAGFRDCAAGRAERVSPEGPDGRDARAAALAAGTDAANRARRIAACMTGEAGREYPLSVYRDADTAAAVAAEACLHAHALRYLGARTKAVTAARNAALLAQAAEAALEHEDRRLGAG